MKSNTITLAEQLEEKAAGESDGTHEFEEEVLACGEAPPIPDESTNLPLEESINFSTEEFMALLSQTNMTQSFEAFTFGEAQPLTFEESKTLTSTARMAPVANVSMELAYKENMCLIAFDVTKECKEIVSEINFTVAIITYVGSSDENEKNFLNYHRRLAKALPSQFKNQIAVNKPSAVNENEKSRNAKVDSFVFIKNKVNINGQSYIIVPAFLIEKIVGINNVTFDKKIYTLSDAYRKKTIASTFEHKSAKTSKSLRKMYDYIQLNAASRAASESEIIVLPTPNVTDVNSTSDENEEWEHNKKFDITDFFPEYKNEPGLKISAIFIKESDFDKEFGAVKKQNQGNPIMKEIQKKHPSVKSRNLFARGFKSHIIFVLEPFIKSESSRKWLKKHHLLNTYQFSPKQKNAFTNLLIRTNEGKNSPTLIIQEMVENWRLYKDLFIFPLQEESDSEKGMRMDTIKEYHSGVADTESQKMSVEMADIPEPVESDRSESVVMSIAPPGDVYCYDDHLQTLRQGKRVQPEGSEKKPKQLAKKPRTVKTTTDQTGKNLEIPVGVKRPIDSDAVQLDEKTKKPTKKSRSENTSDSMIVHSETPKPIGPNDSIAFRYEVYIKILERSLKKNELPKKVKTRIEVALKEFKSTSSKDITAKQFSIYHLNLKEKLPVEYKNSLHPKLYKLFMGKLEKIYNNATVMPWLPYPPIDANKSNTQESIPDTDHFAFMHPVERLRYLTGSPDNTNTDFESIVTMDTDSYELKPITEFKYTSHLIQEGIKYNKNGAYKEALTIFYNAWEECIAIYKKDTKAYADCKKEAMYIAQYIEEICQLLCSQIRQMTAENSCDTRILKNHKKYNLNIDDPLFAMRAAEFNPDLLKSPEELDYAVNHLGFFASPAEQKKLKDKMTKGSNILEEEKTLKNEMNKLMARVTYLENRVKFLTPEEQKLKGAKVPYYIQELTPDEQKEVAESEEKIRILDEKIQKMDFGTSKEIGFQAVRWEKAETKKIPAHFGKYMVVRNAILITDNLLECPQRLVTYYTSIFTAWQNLSVLIKNFNTVDNGKKRKAEFQNRTNTGKSIANNSNYFFTPNVKALPEMGASEKKIHNEEKKQLKSKPSKGNTLKDKLTSSVPQDAKKRFQNLVADQSQTNVNSGAVTDMNNTQTSQFSLSKVK